MTEGILLGLPLALVVSPLLLLALGIGNASIEAVNDCRIPTGQRAASADLGDLGAIAGPVGGPVRGRIGVASANIPDRSGLGGFRASMRQVLSTGPDFVTLNEQSGRTLAQIEGAAPGYHAYRPRTRSTGPGAKQSMGNVVLWRSRVWEKQNGGRVKIVEDDQTYYSGRPVTWDRFATWVLVQRRSDGAVVSIIVTHQMTNPQRFPRQHGGPPLSRTQQYGAGMDLLLQLRNTLATHGPVLVAGDMNTHSSQGNLPWSAAAKMKAAGYGWYHHSVDFVFFPQHQGATLVRGWTGRMASDHQWVAARIAMNGAGPDSAGSTEFAAGDPVTTTGHSAASTGSGDVTIRLLRLHLADSYPTLTREQTRNAIAIAQVARDLKVPEYGLQIAVATAIQESKLVNLIGGDRDSAGVFQQRPSQGWGSRAQVTNPLLAARAFFGEAQHTNNPGLLDIPGWSAMPLARAAQAVQGSGHPDAYAQWEGVAGDIAAILGDDLPAVPPHGAVSAAGECPQRDAGYGEVIYPISSQEVAADLHNWHESGSRWDSWHSGTDFAAPCGTPVYAAHAGTIQVDTTQDWAGPWLVQVTTGPGDLTTWYAHMDTLTVSRGEIVAPGQQIGLVGREGNATGCHLHFEVHLRNGSIYGPDNVDPSNWLAQRVWQQTA